MDKAEAQNVIGRAGARGWFSNPLADPAPFLEVEMMSACIEGCPLDALHMGNDDLPNLDLDQFIGCGACATGCPETAIMMNQREGKPVPPPNRKALKAAIQASISG